MVLILHNLDVDTSQSRPQLWHQKLFLKERKRMWERVNPTSWRRIGQRPMQRAADEKFFARFTAYRCLWKVAMFLLIIGYNCRNFLIQDVLTFGGNGEPSLSHYAPLQHLQRRWLSPLHLTRLLRKYWKLRSTIHVSSVFVIIPTEKAIPYRSRRKNECIQNVMTVCSFDL